LLAIVFCGILLAVLMALAPPSVDHVTDDVFRWVHLSGFQHWLLSSR
jgi:hypothetical protein